MIRDTFVAALAAGFLLTPLRANACSKVGFVPVKAARQAHFIGVATADTLFAGAGGVKYEVAPGHSGPPVDRRIYGQLISVERIGGDVVSQLRRPVTRMVLVPWDYAADCTPTPWARSARWVEPGTRGFFVAVLRDSAHWTDGIPTFDVFSPEMYPYPQKAHRMMRRPLVTPNMLLDIEHVFALADMLPDHRLVRDSADIALQPLFVWTRTNPQLARRYPASDVLRWATYSVMQSRLRRIKPSAIGTYRFTIAIDGGSEQTYFARTRPVPSSAVNLTDRPAPADPTYVPKPDGYYILVTGALSPDSLSRNCEEDRNPNREGYILVLDRPPMETARGKEWVGKIEMDLITRVFPADSAIRQFARADFQRFSQQRGANLPFDTPARFIEAADGTLRIEQDIVLGDGRRAQIRGQRISTTTIVCSW